MRSFFKYVFACLLALCLFAFAGFVFFSIIIASLATQTSSMVFEGKAPLSKKVIDSEAILYLPLRGNIPDDTTQEEANFLRDDNNEVVALPTLLSSLQDACSNDKIKAISVHFKQTNADLATLGEIRDALLKCKSQGKSLYGYAYNLQEKEHYVTSALDTLMMYPEGFVEFDGFSITSPFFADLLNGIDAKVYVFRAGNFKAAVEPLIRNNYSEANKIQLNTFLNDIYDNFLNAIAKKNNTPIDQLRKLAEQLNINSSRSAQTHGLVDIIGTYEDYETMLRRKLNLKSKAELPLIRYNELPQETKNHSHNQIALLTIEGEINNESAQTLAKNLVKVRNENNVKAVVIRINSPGGGFIPSDMLWEKIQYVREKKPVIASMGNMAASGGYYIATACSTIFASPTTLTGSIGVFSLFFDISQSAKHMGISFDKVATNPLADNTYDITQPMKTQSITYRQQMTENVYQTFVNKVAKSRNITPEYAHTIAQGRIWSGQNAKHKKLVDNLGGLQQAIQNAAKQANIKSYTIYIPQKNNIERLMTMLAQFVTTKQWITQWLNNTQTPPLKQIHQTLKPYQDIQARLLYDIYMP